jgi:hypothetical protein
MSKSPATSHTDAQDRLATEFAELVRQIGLEVGKQAVRVELDRVGDIVGRQVQASYGSVIEQLQVAEKQLTQVRELTVTGLNTSFREGTKQLDAELKVGAQHLARLMESSTSGLKPTVEQAQVAVRQIEAWLTGHREVLSKTLDQTVRAVASVESQGNEIGRETKNLTAAIAAASIEFKKFRDAVALAHNEHAKAAAAAQESLRGVSDGIALLTEAMNRHFVTLQTEIDGRFITAQAQRKEEAHWPIVIAAASLVGIIVLITICVWKLR